jgi:hypothetical protein
MIKKQSHLQKNKIDLIKNLYNQALNEINMIEKKRDEKILNILKDRDSKQITKILQDIKNIK